MKKNIFLVTSIVATLFMAGCATNEKIVGTQAAPGAEGKITAGKVAGDNTELKVEVEHLAKPDRVLAGATNYIVWVQPEGTSTVQNVGVLNVDDDLEGEYQTTVPYKDFRVMVTPEIQGNASYPTGPIVFDQFISR